MKKGLILMVMVLLVLSLSSIVSASDLTGTWSCNDGGIYYIRQIGDTINWYGEKSPIHPTWSNVANGKIIGNKIYIEYVDVPKGRDLSSGTLTLEIIHHNRLIRTEVDGGFGGSAWRRWDR